MERKSTKYFELILKLLRPILFLFFSLFVFWIFTFSFSVGFLRSISMLLRTGYTLVVPAILLVLYLSFCLKGWFGNLISLSIMLSIFALALAGVWASGQTESGLLSGVIPMFDSANYYSDSLRLLAGTEFSDGSTRRPMFIAFFAFLLWIAKHNLLIAHTLLTLLVSMACYLLAKEIHNTHGAAIASFVIVFIFIYFRYHSGVVRTENLGILFGVLGTAFLWSGITKRIQSYTLAGIFLTSIGMVARAGAFFILPLLVLWGAVLFRKNGKSISWPFLAWGTIAVALTFFVNQLIVKSFGTSNIVPFGNFSYSLYGLASGGKSWAYVFEIYPEADDLEIYKMAFQLILNQPGLILKGVAYNYSMFFSNTNYGLFSYMSGEGQIIASISYWTLMLLSILGVLAWFQRREDPFLGFVMTSLLGLLISVPFLPPTDTFRLRSYATSIVILALLPAMGLHSVLTKLKMDKLNAKDSSSTHKNLLTVFSLFVVAIVVIGPFLARGTEFIPKLNQSSCEAGLIPLVVRYDPGSIIHLVSQNTVLLDRAPTFHIGTFHRNVHGFPNFDFMDWALEYVAPNYTLFSALDYRTFRPVLAVVRSDIMPAPPVMLELCGTWEENPKIVRFNVFYVSSVDLIGQE